MAQARRITLTQRPAPGFLTSDCFALETIDRPEPGPGQFRVAISHVSCDPAMRGWVNAGRSYIEPVAIGAVMRAFASGIVDASQHPDFAVGDAVMGLLGVQDTAVSDGTGVYKVDFDKAPPARWLGGLGMPGWTAYFGLLDVGKPSADETVCVSAASGAVGSIVGQIAKLKGCRAVGIAGGPEKCRALIDELGFDAAVDYKADTFAADLAAACPDGIDVHFENVGGTVLDTALPLMNTFGRIPLCGLISAYTATSQPPGPTNMRAILTQRLRVQGLIVFDWADRIPEAIQALGDWHANGQLVMREDVRTAPLSDFPEIVNDLFTGANQGKLVIELSS